MQADLQTKLQAMLWDLPESQRKNTIQELLSDPVSLFHQQEQLLIKALNTLSWYDLINLVGKENIGMFLSDSAIQKLFPAQRRSHYIHARRLLSKYTVPASGQNT